MTEQDVEVRDDEDLAMEAAHAAIEASRNKDSGAETQPAPEVAETPEQPPEQEGTAPVSDEPFEGFSQLSEAARAKWLELDAKAKRADELAAAEAKIRGDFNALHNRMAPLQRKLSDYEKQPRAQAPQAQAAPGFNDWLKGTSKEYQQWAREFGEDAKLQYEHAMRVTAEADRRIRSVEESVESKFRDLELKNEVSRLAAIHGDYKDYAFREEGGQRVPLTQKAADYFKWAAEQGDEVQAAVYGDSAADVAATLSVYKWEKSEPVVRETMTSPEFQSWLGTQSRHISAMARSLDIEDRKDVMQWYIGHLDQQKPAQADPKTAARVQQVAQRREQQSRSVSPSFRPNVAPASAANTGGEDADWAAANARIEQWRKKQ